MAKRTDIKVKNISGAELTFKDARYTENAKGKEIASVLVRKFKADEVRIVLNTDLVQEMIKAKKLEEVKAK